MSKETFYRKYRPQTFDEIVGQHHIVETLNNAIQHNRLSHAYIFSGPRGTGKTSNARILAKTLNCKTTTTHTPCLTCDICKHISNGTSVDIVEIDAASNTGVDNIRSLNDTVNFSPIECQYKLYIIDEAHMLSTGAFNALLKTLEEPPEKTIFILATTEPHKIPITIHSRCQHLHFRNLTSNEIIQQLRHVATNESLTIDDTSLNLIAKNSSGCMRDGLSLLNQAYSFKGETINSTDILYILGSTEDSTLLNLLDAVITHNDKAIIEQLQTLAQQGANATQLLKDLLQITNQLIWASLGLTSLIDGTTDHINQVQALAQKTTLSFLKQLLESLANTESELRWFSQPSLLLQIRLVGFSQAPTTSTQIPATQPSTPQPAQKSFSPASQTTTTITPTTPPVTTHPSITSINDLPEPGSASQPAPQTSTKASSPAPPQNTTQVWNTLLSDIKKQSNALYSVLRGSTVSREDDHYIYVKLKQSFKFFINKLSEPQHQTLINEKLSTLLSTPKQFKLDDGTTSSTNTAETSPSKPAENTDLHLINQVVKLFEGTIV